MSDTQSRINFRWIYIRIITTTFSRSHYLPSFQSPRSSIRTIDTLARLAVFRGPLPLDICRVVFPYEGLLDQVVQRGRLRNPTKAVNYIARIKSHEL